MSAELAYVTVDNRGVHRQSSLHVQRTEARPMEPFALLARAVLYQAGVDAKGPLSLAGKDKTEQMLNRRRALLFLGSPWFMTIAECAGLDPDNARAHILRGRFGRSGREKRNQGGQA